MTKTAAVLIPHETHSFKMDAALALILAFLFYCAFLFIWRIVKYVRNWGTGGNQNITSTRTRGRPEMDTERLGGMEVRQAQMSERPQNALQRNRRSETDRQPTRRTENMGQTAAATPEPTTHTQQTEVNGEGQAGQRPATTPPNAVSRAAQEPYWRTLYTLENSDQENNRQSKRENNREDDRKNKWTDNLEENRKHTREDDSEDGGSIVSVSYMDDSEPAFENVPESALFPTIEKDDHADTNWYSKSRDTRGLGGLTDIGGGVHISQEQLNKFKIKDEKEPFYKPFETDLDKKLNEDPDTYKRCQLKIRSPHRSIAHVLDADKALNEIIISGRSKCGQTFTDDEVVVKVVHRPRGKESEDRTTDHVTYGLVVGLLTRRHHHDVEHTVMLCTLDKHEGHLMKPMCLSVPKIHVLNDGVKRQHFSSSKHVIEIKEINVGKVKHKGFVLIKPGEREQYVFAVAFLAWAPSEIYPLGAVLGYQKTGAGGREAEMVLSVQHQVPRTYPENVVDETKTLTENYAAKLQEISREDKRTNLTDKRIFTIDPDGSRDLDDALSVWTEGDKRHIVGVHIADVTSLVKEGTELDDEAQRRAVTFYPTFGKPHHMLPEPVSEDLCSLLPGQVRPAISVFYTFIFNNEQELVEPEEPRIERTTIRSCKQLTYDQVQRVIDDPIDSDEDEDIGKDIRLLHEISSKLGEHRTNTLWRNTSFEDPRLVNHPQPEDDAHNLVSELMIKTNAYIAQYLRSKFPKFMILRCHAAPTWQDLAEWREKEGSVANLVMQLQGRKVSPDTQLSYDTPTRCSPYQRRDVVVQTSLWTRLQQHLKGGEFDQARQLAFMDDVHPLQCLANQHWMELMDRAQYKCSYGLNPPEHSHFGLDLPCYTHFTSPIRRYADLHVHRLLHADLDGRPPGCDPDDVTRLCQLINSATARQKAFGKGCLALKIADSLKNQPLVFRTFVEQVDSEQLTLMVPSLRAVSDRKQELPFSILGVSKQPKLAKKKTSIDLQWNKRVYVYIPERQTAKRKDCGKKASGLLSGPATLYINPRLHIQLVKQTYWAHVVKTLINKRTLTKKEINTLKKTSTAKGQLVDYMRSASRDGASYLRACHFRMTLTPGHVLLVQMSAEPRKGVLTPRVDLVHIALNGSLCLQHARDPVTALGFVASTDVRNANFTNHEDYMSAWMPLLEMEAEHQAGRSDEGVVIEDVPITISVNDVNRTSGRASYKGSFRLGAKFCFDRCIVFGGKSFSHIDEESCETVAKGMCNVPLFPLDYLCIRYKTECSETTSSRVERCPVPEAVDTHVTWVGHASIVNVTLKGRVNTEGGDLVVTFLLSRTSPPPPQALTDKDKFTVELIPKNEVDRRAQQMLVQLDGCELGRAIAYGYSIPPLDDDRVRLGMEEENHEVPRDDMQQYIPKNNNCQTAAIQMALSNSFSLIQGPPGTGKTYTGIKLVYLFCKINRQLEADGKGKKTVLFCGPSNKSVDLVAKMLRNKLGSRCPSIVRIYGSHIESNDYPVPGGTLRSTRGMRTDRKCDTELQDVALHHIIRRKGRQYAEQIAKYEEHFQKTPSSVDHKLVKEYYSLIHRACIDELPRYEVVFTTCAVAGSSRIVAALTDKVYQVLIDECAMSPEPLSLVPIIATEARQVVLIGDHCQLRPIITCQAAADLGLDQSLFERLFDKYPEYTVFLNTQYRMHPSLSQFPSEEFYHGRLLTAQVRYNESENALPFWPRDQSTNELVPHILVDVRGEESTLSVTTEEGNERSKSNPKEADKVMEILSLFKHFKIELKDVKVLTQYNAQCHLLEERVKKLEGERTPGINCNDRQSTENAPSTVVLSQGGEWDYVILSTVRSLPSYKIEPNPTHGWCRQNLGFITDRNQVNVALTRARKGLIIVGNVELLSCDKVWCELVNSYKHLGCVFSAENFPPPGYRRR